MKLDTSLKISPTLKMILIITMCFMLFAFAMLINVYADANTDVIDKRNEIDKIKIDIRNQKSLIASLELEEDYWNDRLTVVEDYLEERQNLAEQAKRDYETALKNKVQTVEDIEFIDAVKKLWEDRVNDVKLAQINVDNNTRDLNSYELRLAEAKAKLKALETELPDSEELLEELLVVANRALPKTVYGTHSAIIISIVLSDGCLVSDTCPNYLELADVYDNSNRYISGDFFEIETGQTRPIYQMIACEGNCSTDETLQKVGDENIKIWKRGLPLYAENTIGWYQYSAIPVLTFVDPDDETRVMSKKIIIEPSLPEGFNRDTIVVNNTITYGVDRHINGCNNAVIGWNPHGDELLADTWNYFYNNCGTTTSFNNTVSTYYPPTIFTDCHRWCEHLKWVEEAKLVAKTAFGKILE
jgi:hypothetical protein